MLDSELLVEVKTGFKASLAHKEASEGVSTSTEV